MDISVNGESMGPMVRALKDGDIIEPAADGG